MNRILVPISLSVVFLLMFVSLAHPATAFAQTTDILDNPIQADSLAELLTSVLRGVVRIAAMFLVLAFVWIGFKFAAAQGNSEELQKTRTILVWTVVGALILLGAELIADIILATAGSLTP